MAKDLKEQIEIMTHYLNNGEVECVEKGNDNWEIATKPLWNFDDFDYRIRELKEKVTIETWLMKDASNGEYFIYESSRVDLYLKETFNSEKVKLIESYEVEL